jgi:hypothetical protein
MPSLTRRLPGLAATVPPGPSLVLTVRHQARRYRAEIYDPGTGRTWRCLHRHLNYTWASRCAAVMARRIERRGWPRAAGPQRRIRRARGRSG